MPSCAPEGHPSFTANPHAGLLAGPTTHESSRYSHCNNPELPGKNVATGVSGTNYSTNNKEPLKRQ